jgi:hypothetical protein
MTTYRCAFPNCGLEFSVPESTEPRCYCGTLARPEDRIDDDESDEEE